MADDSDASRILREREQRRAVELSRIRREREDRELELGRLRLVDLERPGPAFDAPDPFERELGAPPRARRPGVASDERASPDELSFRKIGGALRPPGLTVFLQTNPVEQFDIEALNQLALSGIVASAQGDPDLLVSIVRHAEALMERVKLELDDPLTAGAFLRERVLRWYRESPNDPHWPHTAPTRWAGLFTESRISGGRLAPWLNVRLWSLREQALRAGALRHRLRRGLSRDRRIEASVARTPSQQIRAEVAQAILDDVAAHGRDADGPIPLVHLSELAVRRQVQTVNDSLALLFSGPESGPFVLLHPNRYPDCDELQIRPPAAGATGAAMAFSLATGRVSRRTGGRGRATSESGLEPPTVGADAPSSDAGEEVDASTIWEAEEVGPEDWRRVVKERRRERRRLDSPPRDGRTHPAYTVLRDLLFEDPEFRQAFLGVKWRGRPPGLPLLATLLQKGTLSPEVATDHEYLEAELGDLVQGDTQWHPSDGNWSARNWTIVREGSHREGFRFTARRMPEPKG